MVAKKIIGLIVPVVLLVGSVVAGFVFFGVVAFAIAGIVALFFLLSLLVYLNKRWKYLLAWMHGKFNKGTDTEKRKERGKKRGRWKTKEEIIVGEIEMRGKKE